MQIQSKLKTLAVITSILIGIVAFSLFFPVRIPDSGTIFYVHPGMSRTNVVLGLADKQLVHNTTIFDVYTLITGKVPKSGEYLLPRFASPYTIWKQITAGTGRYYRSFSIIPGNTFSQVKAALQNNPYLKHTTASMKDQDIMAALGDPSHAPEGLFMPETYHFARGDTDLALLKRSYDLMALKLAEAWRTRSAGLPFQTPYDALIAASLIEKEAYLVSEQPIISGVLVNRLKKNMLLQFDPTIIYGLGSAYQGKIYKKDLTTNTTYNTYLHKGLPPTPIAMPGRTAIEAATHPAQHDYYYFVAKGDGSHQFTTNLQDHYQAVEAAAARKANATH